MFHWNWKGFERTRGGGRIPRTGCCGFVLCVCVCAISLRRLPLFVSCLGRCERLALHQPLHLPEARRCCAFSDGPQKRKTGRLLDGGMEWQWMGARCVVGSSWCYYMTDMARREFFLLLLQASMPAAMTMVSTGFSTCIFAPLAASLQDPRGLVPPKWTGRLRATALVTANWTCNRPRLGGLGVSCRVRVHRLVVTPRVCASTLTPAPRSMCSACGSAFMCLPLPVDEYVWNVATVVADWAVVQAGFPVEMPMIGVSMEKRARAAQAVKLWGYSRRQAVRLSISV